MSTFQERQAVFDSLVRKFPNKPLADTAMDEILQLRAENEALAARVEKMRLALRGDVLLEEPVYIWKALLAGRQAQAVVDVGDSSKAAVHLVNIGLTGWVHTKETAEAFAAGFNMALKQLRSSVLERGTDTTSISILAERDARTLRMVADIADQWAEGRQPEHGGYALRNFAISIRAKADELTKQGIST